MNKNIPRTLYSSVPMDVQSLTAHYQGLVGQLLSTQERDNALQSLVFYLEHARSIDLTVLCIKGALPLLYLYLADERTTVYARTRIAVYEGFLRDVGALS